MRNHEELSRMYSRGFEQLRISELLMLEAFAKQQRHEEIEARELRDEAFAYRSQADALLGKARAEERRSLLNRKGRAHAFGGDI